MGIPHVEEIHQGGLPHDFFSAFYMFLPVDGPMAESQKLQMLFAAGRQGLAGIFRIRHLLDDPQGTARHENERPGMLCIGYLLLHQPL